jgi:putative methionine-R-sulfoxide reductase with GAF domain
MATSTAIASLETLAVIHRSNDVDEIYAKLISNFKRVPHFDWIGVYSKQGNDMVLKSSSCDPLPTSLSRLSIIQIPIPGDGNILGRITVMTKLAQSADESDYVALRKTAEELGKKLLSLDAST